MFVANNANPPQHRGLWICHDALLLIGWNHVCVCVYYILTKANTFLSKRSIAKNPHECKCGSSWWVRLTSAYRCRSRCSPVTTLTVPLSSTLAAQVRTYPLGLLPHLVELRYPELHRLSITVARLGLVHFPRVFPGHYARAETQSDD